MMHGPAARLRCPATYAVLACGLLAAAPTGAQPIDYDPRRAQELRECDDHQHRGRLDEAHQCYSQLLGGSNLMRQAEAVWALGDVRSANKLFERAVQLNARAVQPRVRWGRLYMQTHQYAEAVELFREALSVAPDDAQAKLGLAHVFAERFEGQAKPLLEEVLKQDGELTEAHLLAARM
ncbi:MAG: tetratricopeptide repeat protein, partial [Lysobacterales bacterium]